MKTKNLLKLSVALMLGAMLLFTMKNFVFAEDENQGTNFWIQYDNSHEFEEASVVKSEDNNKSTDDTKAEDSNKANTESSAVDYNPLNENKSSNTENTEKKENVAEETIPYTGMEEVGSLLAMVIVIGGIVAIYSYRKYSEYNNI